MNPLAHGHHLVTILKFCGNDRLSEALLLFAPGDARFGLA